MHVEHNYGAHVEHTMDVWPDMPNTPYAHNQLAKIDGNQVLVNIMKEGTFIRYFNLADAIVS